MKDGDASAAVEGTARSDSAIEIVERETLVAEPFDYTNAYFAVVQWSPDGRLLGFSQAEQLKVMEPGIGQIASAPLDDLGTWTWTADSRSILLQAPGGARRLAVESGTTHELGLDLVNTAIAANPRNITMLAGTRAADPGEESASVEVILWDSEDAAESWRGWLPFIDGVYRDSPEIAVWSRDGDHLAFNTSQCTVALLDASSRTLLGQYAGHRNLITDIAWHPDGRTFASASKDRTVRIWDAESAQALYILEGHKADPIGCSFSADGRLFASLGGNGEVLFWSSQTWVLIGRADAALPHSSPEATSGRCKLRFHPSDSVLAVAWGSAVQTWRIALTDSTATSATPQYVNAKAVLVGDTGVGKSGLALVLAGRDFAATESTHARQTMLLESNEVSPDGVRRELREVFLWDLAGQPGYRLTHQLHLSEVDVALVVCDARSETDPFSGVTYWARALRHASEREGGGARPIQRFLVVARTDRGSLAVSRQRLEQTLSEEGFDGYFATSAKTGAGVDELGAAVRDAIDWDLLPRVSSPELFLSIKAFLVAEKVAGRLLSTVSNLRVGYMRQAVRPDLARRTEEEEPPFWRRLARRLLDSSDKGSLSGADLLAESSAGRAREVLDDVFDVCVGRVESQGLVRKLSFGDYVLLQPELLDAYAASIVDAARSEPDGLGSLPEEDVLEGRFAMAPEDRIANPKQEKLLLLATVEELLRREIALRESTELGAQLVFPAQSTRDRPEAPDLPPVVVSFGFEGPVMNIWSALVVRLTRSERFRMSDVWRTAVQFEAGSSGHCGLVLEGHEAEGRIGAFFSVETTDETRKSFIEYIRTYLERRSLPDTVVERVVVICPNPDCLTPIPENIVQLRQSRGFSNITCSVCDTTFPLGAAPQPLDRTGVDKIAAMDSAADAERDRQANVTVVEGKVATTDFDVFLCHNAVDKPAVKRIGVQLKEQGLLPWLDEWELRPGTPWQEELDRKLESIRTAAVFIGESGIGPWQMQEMRGYLDSFVERGARVIPVLLPDAPEQPELPRFLKNMSWVDFRRDDPPPFAQLVWGITGQKPPELEIRW